MLVLNRRIGQSIMIGDDVIVTVLGIKGNRAIIGIQAPKDIPVHRDEVYQRISDELARYANEETVERELNSVAR